MHLIKGTTANELFINISKALLREGQAVSPRGLKTLELRDAWLELGDPTQNWVSLPERKANAAYRDAEMQWYEHGSYKAAEIIPASSFWEKLADKHGNVNSNYGMITLREYTHGKSQLEWCIDRLREDKHTRQAVINYNQPKHKYEGNKDYVCTLSQMFRVNDDRLDSTVMMRSNDIIYGLTYDLPWFTSLQMRVAKAINIPVGIYQHYAASLHVYERHIPLVIAMSAAEDTLNGQSRLL